MFRVCKWKRGGWLHGPGREREHRFELSISINAREIYEMTSVWSGERERTEKGG